jgi:hypothetical protein
MVKYLDYVRVKDSNTVGRVVQLYTDTIVEADGEKSEDRSIIITPTDTLKHYLVSDLVVIEKELWASLIWA